jgi:hypothetical protein
MIMSNLAVSANQKYYYAAARKMYLYEVKDKTVISCNKSDISTVTIEPGQYNALKVDTKRMILTK